jgi:hypothetical protein
LLRRHRGELSKAVGAAGLFALQIVRRLKAFDLAGDTGVEAVKIKG